jgi:tetratricopeptide (TPR) repeat protein
MKQNRRHALPVSIFVFLSFHYLTWSATAQERCEDWVAKVVSVQGEVQARKADKKQWVPVKLNDTFCPGDMIRLHERSRAAFLLPNETTLRLDQRTTVTFTGVEKKRVSLLDLIKGAVHFFSRTPRGLKVATPFVNGSVEGTEFFVRVDPDQTFLSIFEGRVLTTNNAGSLLLTTGQSAIAKARKAPQHKTVLRPRDAVQWALYYPPLLDYSSLGDSRIQRSSWRSRYQRSIELYIKGDIAGAFSILEALPQDIDEPALLTYRAGLLLSVGRVDEAGSDIERALNLAPSDSHALALQSIVALAQNDKNSALVLAQKAIEANPQASEARVALSYAQQANFDLQSTLASLQEAVRLAPDDALARARLAELWLSLGYLDRALEAAQKAVLQNPDLARTQTVLGFAYLTQIQTAEAKKAFEKAIELNQADPLPRLGLGLAIIRDGDVEKGRIEIEIAAALDPNNSLIRSYLGKAFFEERRNSLSKDELSIAKKLDPMDPTPWFYDAIRKQTVNRPVEALHDLQKSIELNDNRAVYRSQLMLDEDLAARSASLGRIYRDLGFEQLALVEGWKSLNTDPANYSAHRFLADTYSTLPRHEIARVSELLQSQLLQPINITPVQPRLAETNLLIIEGSGPAEPAFNEFNPLFYRNRLALQGSGVVSDNDIAGSEVVHSGLWGKASYSLGAFHYRSDGYRDNNDLEQDLYNAFAQVSLSRKTSIQAEYRSNDNEKGDLGLQFDPDDFLANLRVQEDTKSIRFGFHHAFTPGADVIGSFIHQDTDSTLDDILPVGTLDVETHEESYTAELQYLFRAEHFNIIGGAGHANVNGKDERTTSISLPLPFPPFLFTATQTEIQKNDIQHTNLYLYSQINYPENITWTLGASGDFFDGALEDRDQFNPKFGLTWNPSPSTTLRAAAFRTLKRTLITNQTIEPTQVAGFNQFFDDADITESWRYGIAIEQKFSENIYAGLALSARDLEVPFEQLPLPTEPTVLRIDRVDWKEYLGRAYLYWTPHPILAASAEFQYEKLDRDEAFVAGIEEVETYRLPLGLSFYHPSGFSSRLTATYIDQEGTFQRQSSNTFISGKDSFWVVDASLGYRLPKRYGLISLDVRNLFNESFRFQDTDPVSPAIQPERLVLFKFTWAF